MLSCWAPAKTPARLIENPNMKIKNIVCSMMAVGLVAGGLTACRTEKGEEAKLEAAAKVTRADAERMALAKVPNGTLKSGEIEKEKGKLIWSFDISTPGTGDITEVNIDVLTGEVVGIDKETAADEAKEKQGKKEKEENEKDEKK